MQHREGSICNTPNDLILAQFATQRWLNLQHTKIYKQPFRFNWVGTGGGDSWGGLGLGELGGLGSGIVFTRILLMLLATL